MAHVDIIVSGQANADAVVSSTVNADAVVPSQVYAPGVVQGQSSANAVEAGQLSADALIKGIKGDPGVAGMPGADGNIVGAVGPSQSVQYKSGIYLAGANQLLYYTGENKLLLDERTLLVKNGKIHLHLEPHATEKTDAFLLRVDKDVDGTIVQDNVFKVDTQNKVINISNSDGDGYKIGIGCANPEEKLHVSGNVKVEGKVTANTGYYDDLYMSGNKVLTGVVRDTELSGYFEEKTDFLFLKTSIPSGIRGTGIPFGKTLSYIPKVVANMIMADGENTVYLMTVGDISNTGYQTTFSSKIHTTGYFMESFVSSSKY